MACPKSSTCKDALWTSTCPLSGREPEGWAGAGGEMKYQLLRVSLIRISPFVKLRLTWSEIFL